ncbi:transposase family protein [Spiroplasma endosymbiont of Polydrusus pterygomalis]|uniref:transposase family protein n=1 Tax=Spiroplasma endosymbiont of Polydrusus pterygomalis TaxID=3139327 RepID=UPI003CCABAAD
MARKGQKFNKYTADFRKRIGQEVKNNSISFIAKKYAINKKTVSSWYENFKKGILNTNKGQKESFEKRDLNYYKVRYELLKKLHDFYN